MGRVRVKASLVISAVLHDCYTPLVQSQYLLGTTVENLGAKLSQGTCQEEIANLKLISDELKAVTSYSKCLLDLILQERGNVNISAASIEKQLRKVLPLASKKINLSITSQPSTLSIQPGILLHILYNLISNSISHNDQQRVDVSVFIKQAENNCFVCVKDNGKGMSPGQVNKLEKISDVKNLKTSSNFQHSSDHTEGLKVGFSIVSKIVRLLKGSLKISSIPGEGTTIKIYLPI